MGCECAICKNNNPFTFPKEIIDAALDGELVLFCGAGVSTESKNVLPFSFYTSIKEALDVKDEDVSFSVLMQQYCNQPNGRKKLLKKFARDLIIFARFLNWNGKPPLFIESWHRFTQSRQLLQQIGIHILKITVGQFPSLFQRILHFGMIIQDAC